MDYGKRNCHEISIIIIEIMSEMGSALQYLVLVMISTYNLWITM